MIRICIWIEKFCAFAFSHLESLGPIASFSGTFSERPLKSGLNFNICYEWLLMKIPMYILPLWIIIMLLAYFYVWKEQVGNTFAFLFLWIIFIVSSHQWLFKKQNFVLAFGDTKSVFSCCRDGKTKIWILNPLPLPLLTCWRLSRVFVVTLYMKKLLDSDWSSVVQFKCNAGAIYTW